MLPQTAVKDRNMLTREQRLEILDAYHTASQRGDTKEAARISRLLPLPPYLAKALKDMYGKEYLLGLGYELAEAEAEYGPDWIDQ
jgi:hypothetical protein